jgi:hypothetical protein
LSPSLKKTIFNKNATIGFPPSLSITMKKYF